MIAKMFRIYSRKQIVVIAAVAVLAIFFTVYDFTNTPMVWVDEGVFTEVAKNLAWHRVAGIQTAPGEFFPMNNLLTTGYPVIWPVALSIKYLGLGLWQVRLPMIAYLLIFLLAAYLLVKKQSGFTVAILSILMLISFSPLYGNGRPVQGEVPGVAFMILGWWLLLKWEERNFYAAHLALLAGGAFGLAAATKPIFMILLPPALLVGLGLRYRSILAQPKALAAFGLGLALPLGLWLYSQFPTLESFLSIGPTYLNLAGDHQSSAGTMTTIGNNLWRFLTETTPVLFLLMLIVVVVNMLRRGPSSATELSVLAFIIFNWLAYLTGTGWYRYFFPAHLVLYLLFPAAVVSWADYVRRYRWFSQFLYLILIVLIIFQFTHLIFWSDTAVVTERSRNRNLAVALAQIDSSQAVTFYDSIEAAVFLPHDNYYQYLAMGDFLEAGNRRLLVAPVTGIIVADQPVNRWCYETTMISRYYLARKINSCEE